MPFWTVEDKKRMKDVRPGLGKMATLSPLPSKRDPERFPLTDHTGKPDMNATSKGALISVSVAPSTFLNQKISPATIAPSMSRNSFLSPTTAGSGSLQPSRISSLDSMNETSSTVSPRVQVPVYSFKGDVSSALTPLSEGTISIVNSAAPTPGLSGKNISASVSAGEMANYWSPWQSFVMDPARHGGLDGATALYADGIMHSVPFGTVASATTAGAVSDHHSGLRRCLHASEEFQNVVYPSDVSVASGSDTAASHWQNILAGHHHHPASATMSGLSALTTTVIPDQTMVNCTMIHDDMDAHIRPDTAAFHEVKREDAEMTDWDVMDISEASPSSGYSIGGFFDSPNQTHLQSPQDPHPQLLLGLPRQSRLASRRHISSSSLPSKRAQQHSSTSMNLPCSSSPIGSSRPTHLAHRPSYPGVHPQNKHLCPNCGRKFQRKEHLRRHETTHDPKAPDHFCPDPKCRRNFKGRRDNLWAHFKTHLRVTKTGRTKSRRTFDEFYRILREEGPLDQAEKDIMRLESWRASEGHLKPEASGTDLSSVGTLSSGRKPRSGSIWRLH